MQHVIPAASAQLAWDRTLRNIIIDGKDADPRGMKTKEILHNTAAFDMRHPVVTSPARKLSYKFMAAEALWILTGDNSVAGIAPYNKHISQFSDNGYTFAGAYGPQYIRQLDYAVDSLVNDADTRQAVIQIWKPNPGKSRDIPCTLNLTFNIRRGFLNCHVFMRSSDVWLGLPYDFFNFTMMAMYVGMRYYELTDHAIRPGHLYWTAASSHLYETNYEAANEVLADPDSYNNGMRLADDFMTAEPAYLMGYLMSLRDNRTRWPDILPARGKI